MLFSRSTTWFWVFESVYQSHAISPAFSRLIVVFYLHTCLVTLVANTKQIMMLNCGGETIDITSFLVQSSDPLQLSELAEPCRTACGSSIVDARFKAFFQVSWLQNSDVTASWPAVFNGPLSAPILFFRCRRDFINIVRHSKRIDSIKRQADYVQGICCVRCNWQAALA